MHIITSIASACATMNGQMPVTILTMFWKYYSSVFCDIVMVESIVDTKTVLLVMKSCVSFEPMNLAM